MNVTAEQMRLYAVTDRSWLGTATLSQQVREALLGGATFVQLREKNIDFDAFVALAQSVKAETRRFRVPLIINDALDVAIAIDADGVHLGQRDIDLQTARLILGPDKIIGVSTHSVAEALEAQRNRADYIGVGAIFSTITKTDTDPVALATLQKICAAVEIPVVAIGGINASNLNQLHHSGIDGVAVVSALFSRPDVRIAASEMRKAVDLLIAESATKEGCHV